MCVPVFLYLSISLTSDASLSLCQSTYLHVVCVRNISNVPRLSKYIEKGSRSPKINGALLLQTYLLMSQRQLQWA